MPFLGRFRALFRRAKLDRDMDDELRFHIEEQTRRNLASGMSLHDAALAARRQFGWTDRIREEARDARGLAWLDATARDVRYAVRVLRKQPGFTAIVATTLAIGIGLNTVVFTFYGAFVFKPLAVRAPDEVVRIVAGNRSGGNDAFSYAEFEDLRDRTHALQAVVATSAPQVMLAALPTANAPREQLVTVRFVSGNTFDALGVTPAPGRAFHDDREPVGVLSHEAWQRDFAGDPAVIGRMLRVQNVSITIIGVAPSSFAGTGNPPAAPDLWLPLELQPTLLPEVDWLHDSTAREWQILGRRRADVSLKQVIAELDGLGRTWLERDGRPPQLTARRATLFDIRGPQFHAVFLILLGGVGLILLIAGVNVVNLFSARNASREHELAVRLALGASRGRLVRQLCVESIVLGLLAGVGGLVLSAWCSELIRAWMVGSMREVSGGAWRLFLDLSPDWRVLAFAVAISGLTGMLVGIWPALRDTRARLQTALKQHQPGGGGGIRGGSWNRRNVLLTAQIAASLVLLAGAGLLFRGAAHARRTDPGFDAKHILWMQVNLRTVASTPEARDALLRELTAQLRARPEVASLTLADRPPFLGHRISPIRAGGGAARHDSVSTFVADDYFATLGIPLMAGRLFSPAELETNAPVVVISESAARHLWPGENPLGRQLVEPKRNKDRTHPTFTVIGVVRDARLTLLSKTDEIDLFHPKAWPTSNGSATLLLRTRSEPAAAIPPLFAALRGINATLPSQTSLLTLEHGPMRMQRLLAEGPALLASILGLLALTLASVGVYGVVSFMVARRTREIGVRVALGAARSDVIGMVLRQILRPVVGGAALGALGATGISVVLARLLADPEIPDLTYGAGAFPAAIFAGVFGVLLGVIILAAFLPARRAAKVDPMIALRAE